MVIRRRVRPGREAEYEQWLERLQVDARGLPGYMGATTQRPAADGPREYVSVIRFATLAALEAFETGDLRRRHLTAVADTVEDVRRLAAENRQAADEITLGMREIDSSANKLTELSRDNADTALSIKRASARFKAGAQE